MISHVSGSNCGFGTTGECLMKACAIARSLDLVGNFDSALRQHYSNAAARRGIDDGDPAVM